MIINALNPKTRRKTNRLHNSRNTGISTETRRNKPIEANFLSYFTEANSLRNAFLPSTQAIAKSKNFILRILKRTSRASDA